MNGTIFVAYGMLVGYESLNAAGVRFYEDVEDQEGPIAMEYDRRLCREARTIFVYVKESEVALLHQKLGFAPTMGGPLLHGHQGLVIPPPDPSWETQLHHFASMYLSQPLLTFPAYQVFTFRW